MIFRRTDHLGPMLLPGCDSVFARRGPKPAKMVRKGLVREGGHFGLGFNTQ
jgi:hypothetical protein